MDTLNPPPVRLRSCFLMRVRGRISHTALTVGLFAMIMSPMRMGLGAWVDTNGDGSVDSWQSTDGAIISLGDLTNGGDADWDGLSDAIEASEGSNPFNPDSDFDGILDGEEYYIVRPAMALRSEPVSLLSPDSDGDGYSDYDEFHGCYVANYGGGMPYLSSTFCDYDGDGLLNTVDGYPLDPKNNDVDQDGIDDSVDPDSTSSSCAQNYSPTNYRSWYGDALGDLDGDGITNYYDPAPESAPVVEPLWIILDRDGDGISNDSDPQPDNPENYSPTNGVYWFRNALGDEDGDGYSNYVDAYPYDSANGSMPNSDRDGDGISNDSDPVPDDAANYSSANGVCWFGNALGDQDGDGYSNYADVYPYDSANGSIPNSDRDGDGIGNDSDPVPDDAANYSFANSISWFSNALGNADGDGYINFEDPYPFDSANGSAQNDNDSDGLSNELDPQPNDSSNFSSTNGTNWYASALGDDDCDGILNYNDVYPYDSLNGNPTTSPSDTTAESTTDTDLDGVPDSNDSDKDDDGLPNEVDPSELDASNVSSNNGIAWYGSPLADADQDGINNFMDAFPYDTFDNIADFDGDGYANSDDPYPKDTINTSHLNGSPWPGNTMFLDYDNDNLPNWKDPYPYDWFNGKLDYDGDGIANTEDIAPLDKLNISDANGISWFSEGGSDFDMDSVRNFDDPTPYALDVTNRDGDPFSDNDDPYPEDPTNTSEINGIAWGKDVNKDNDHDGTPNYADDYPEDPFDGIQDYDYDGIGNGYDPAPKDATNYSPNNGERWYGYALHDIDGDGVTNWHDPMPRDGWRITDVDHDGILNVTDPYPNDATNLSLVNHIRWGATALQDDDGDGQPNWSDKYPNDADDGASNDLDNDGLTSSQEEQYGTSDTAVDTDDDGLTDYEEKITFNTNPLDAYSVSKAHGNASHQLKDGLLVDLTDTDGDDIPDKIEILYGLDPSNAADAEGDLDADGTINLAQYNLGMALNVHLNAYDRDNDSMSDLYEDYWGFDKHDPSDAVLDRDGDHVLNFEERFLGLLPNNPDTQHSGVLGDYLVWLKASIEPSLQTNAADANTNDIPDWVDSLLQNHILPNFYPANSHDWDHDGLPDAWEHQYGQWRYPNGLNLRIPDAEQDIEVGGGDGLPNLIEYQLGLSPVLSDSDGNGINDGEEDWDHDGLTNRQEIHIGTDPRNADSDGNGIKDGLEDSDGDGITNAQELSRRLDPFSNMDSDGDGVPNDWEAFYGFNPTDPGDVGADDDNDGVITRVEYSTWKTNPRNPDTDGDGITDFNDGAQAMLNGLDAYAKANDKDFDGLTDSDEAINGTDPEKADTDGDGLLDSWEVTYGFNPLSIRPSRAETESAANRHDLVPVLNEIEALEQKIVNSTAVLASVPSAYDVLKSRANAYLKLGRFDEALADYDKYIAKKPADLDARNDRAVTKARTGLRTPQLDPNAAPGSPLPALGFGLEGALADWDFLVKTKPNWANVRHNRALVLMALERYDDAIKDYNFLLAKDPKDPLAQGRKAHANDLLLDQVPTAPHVEVTTATATSASGTPSSHNFKPDDASWTMEGTLKMAAFLIRQLALYPNNIPIAQVQTLSGTAVGGGGNSVTQTQTLTVNQKDYFTTFQDDTGSFGMNPSTPGSGATMGSGDPAFAYPQPDTILHLSEAELDSDGDRLTNEQEHATYQPYGSASTALDPRQALDLDGDLLPDDWETYYDLHNGPNPVPTSTSTTSSSSTTTTVTISTGIGGSTTVTDPTLNTSTVPPVPPLEVPAQDNPNDDPDHDGLTNFEEFFWTNTSPRDPDTNRNGNTDTQDQMQFYKDQLDSFAAESDPTKAAAKLGSLQSPDILKWTLNQLHLPDPTISSDPNGNPPQVDPNDIDGDGLSNDDEVLYGTNPRVTDTDGGGVNDGEEVRAWKETNTQEGHDPLVSSDDFDQADLDNDGLNNADEKKERTNPNNPDTDGGGVNDGDEVRARNTAPRDGADNPIFGNPLKASDDNESNDDDQDGLSNGEETIEDTDPDDPDTDRGGVKDGDEVHNRTTGNHWEPKVAADDVRQTDTDKDGMPDEWETSHNLNPNDAADAKLDPDGDDLKNLEEYQNDTDPNNADTDGGGVDDGTEIKNQKKGQTDPPVPSDPLDPQDDAGGSPPCACVDINGKPNKGISCYCFETVDTPFGPESRSTCHCGPCDCDYAGAGDRPSGTTYCGGQGACGHDDCSCDDSCVCAPGSDACGGDKKCGAAACLCSSGGQPNLCSDLCTNNDCGGDKTCGDGCTCSKPPKQCSCLTSDPCGGSCSNCTCGDCSACGCKDDTASSCTVQSPGSCSCKDPEEEADCEDCGCDGSPGEDCTDSCACTVTGGSDDCDDDCGCEGNGFCGLNDCDCVDKGTCAGATATSPCCTTLNACGGNCKKTGCTCTPPPCQNCGCDGEKDETKCKEISGCSCTLPGGGGGPSDPNNPNDPNDPNDPNGPGGGNGGSNPTPTKPAPDGPDKPEKAPGKNTAAARALPCGNWVNDPNLPEYFKKWLEDLWHAVEGGEITIDEDPSGYASSSIANIAHEVAQGRATLEAMPASVRPFIEKGIDDAKKRDNQPELPLPPKPSVIDQFVSWLKDALKSEPKRPEIGDTPVKDPVTEPSQWEGKNVDDPRLIPILDLAVELIEAGLRNECDEKGIPYNDSMLTDEVDKIKAFIGANGSDSIIIENLILSTSDLENIHDPETGDPQQTIQLDKNLDPITAANELVRQVENAIADSDSTASTIWVSGDDQKSTSRYEKNGDYRREASRKFQEHVTNVLKTGASIAWEPLDIVISLKDAYDGDYWALIGLLPLVPGAASKGMKLIDKAGEAIDIAPGATTKQLAEALLDCAGLCFTGDTPVLTATGLKRIDTIQFGDQVWARDEATKKEGWQPVLATIATHPSELVLLTCQLEDGSRHTVRGTGNHPVWSQSQKKFIEMGQLQVGDHLLLAQHHGSATVQALCFELSPPGTTFTTYNLHVNQWHTYFVVLGEGATGKAGPPAFWVHNTGTGLCDKGKELLDDLISKGANSEEALKAVKAKNAGETEEWVSGSGSLGRDKGMKLNDQIIGGVDTSSQQGHHLVSLQIASDPNFTLFKKAEGLGYNINRGSNGIALPKSAADSLSQGVPMHYGGPLGSYDDTVRDIIAPYEADFKRGVFQDSDIKSVINEIENQIREALITGELRIQSGGWPPPK